MADAVKVTDFVNNKIQVATQIASGQTASGAVFIGGCSLESILWDTVAMTSTAATVQGSMDGTNFYPIIPIGGTADSITVAASKISYLSENITQGVSWIKIVAGTSEGAARNLILGLLPTPG